MKSSRLGLLFIAVLFVLFVKFILHSQLDNDRTVFFPPIIDLCDEYQEHVEETEFRYVHTQRSWRGDKSLKGYCISYDIEDETFNLSTENKKNLNHEYSDDYATYWGDIYRQIHKSNIDQIDYIIDSFKTIQTQKSLDNWQLANAVVKFVQDIPYSYVVPNDCGSSHQDFPCLDHQMFGLTAPVEFLYSLVGDCDSRTVLLYSVLKKLNYDPAILISKHYRHAMLGLNLPASGNYLSTAGKKYYFWETTAEGWEIGMLPPGISNLSYWKIALADEL